MANGGYPIKVIVAKVGLDGHDRGIKFVARTLRDAGMEVVYLGMRQSYDAIARAAMQEDADVVGVSILSGAHMRLIPKVVDALKVQGVFDRTLLIVGGTIPDEDVHALRQMGVAAVFPVGTFTDSIVRFIMEHVKRE